MIKMSPFEKKYDGHMDCAAHIANCERMDFALFQQVYGGHKLTGEEISQHKIRHVHEGYSPWIDKRGRLFAIRREDI